MRVTLIHPLDGTLVAMGTIIIINMVHNYTIKEEEVTISLQKLLGEYENSEGKKQQKQRCS